MAFFSKSPHPVSASALAAESLAPNALIAFRNIEKSYAQWSNT